MWFMDCFCYSACLGSEFPVNSYCDEDVEKLTKAGQQLLKRSLVSGIDEIRIGRASLGQNPRPIADADAEVVGIHALEDDVVYSRHSDEEWVQGLI